MKNQLRTDGDPSEQSKPHSLLSDPLWRLRLAVDALPVATQELERVHERIEALREMFSHAAPIAHTHHDKHRGMSEAQAIEMAEASAKEGVRQGFAAGVGAAADSVEDAARRLEREGGTPALTRDVLYAVAAQLRLGVAS